MSTNGFVTQKDLNNLEEKNDLKLEIIQTKMDDRNCNNSRSFCN